MKNELKNFSKKTNPILISACAFMRDYSASTKAHVGICDHNYMPIPEMAKEFFDKKNICLFCIKHLKQVEVKTVNDLAANPCKEIHIKAIKESHNSGASYTYTCPLGFIFWTSPIFLNGRFTGALLGSGFLETNEKDTCDRMEIISDGTVAKPELMQLLEGFTHGNSHKVKALAELMFICAQSLSPGSEGFHEALRRRSLQQSELSSKIEELKNQSPDALEYPLDKERKLLEAMRRGDTEDGRKLLNEILAVYFFKNQNQFKRIQYRAIELAILLSREGASSVFTINSILENGSLYLKLLLETKNIEELTDTMHRIMDDLAGQIRSLQGIQHASALKKAEDFIMRNFMQKISLKEIAKASGFSAPYFSTIFKEEMGENFSSYLNRLRVEKASALLSGTNFSLSKIANSCGFEDQSWFSKIFKQYIGVSPGKYRNRRKELKPKTPLTGFSHDYLKQMDSFHKADSSTIRTVDPQPAPAGVNPFLTRANGEAVDKCE